MTHRDEPDGSAKRPGPAPSRRSVLRATAGAGAAGLAVTAFGGAVSSAGPRAAAAEALRPHEVSGEPVVVHVRDVTTGEIDVFRGTTQTRVRDRALALRIVRASR